MPSNTLQLEWRTLTWSYLIQLTQISQFQSEEVISEPGKSSVTKF